MLQHGAYTLLKDACYDRETFPTLDEAIDWAWAASKEEIEAVEFVLNKFFCKDDSGYFVQDRVQEELDKYHETSATNKRIANERETKRREKRTKREQAVNDSQDKDNEAPPNQEPRTINQEPVTIKQEPTILECFERFWVAGMTKQNKQGALKSFTAQHKKSKQDIAQFTDYLIDDVQKRLDVGVFGFDKMHPTTYLNQQRWHDDIVKPANVQQTNLMQTVNTLQEIQLSPQESAGALNHD